MGPFQYGSDYGWTPSVVVDYQADGAPTRYRWWDEYSDLTGVAYYEVDMTSEISVILLADAEYEVELAGFDLGSFAGELLLRSVSVMDLSGAILFQELDVMVPEADSEEHLRFCQIPPLSGRQLAIVVDVGGLGARSDELGIDNIRFGQILDSPGSTTAAWCDLDVVLEDVPLTVEVGTPLVFDASAEIECCRSLTFDRATMDVSGPVETSFTLYGGAPIVVASESSAGATITRNVPPGAPLGFYTVTITVFRALEEVSSDSFDLEVTPSD